MNAALPEARAHPGDGPALPYACLSVADMLGAVTALATGIGASEFAVFFIGAARERGRLTPVLDSDHPAVSAASRILSSSFGDDMVKRAVSSTIPTWWSGERESVSTRTLERLPSVQRTPLGLPDMPGLAFPVYGERNLAGLVVFLGTEMTLDAPDVRQIHTHCFRIFSDVIRLGLCQVAQLPNATQRELDCLRLTADGYTSDEIAIVLGLSVHTTNQYLTKITAKLNAINRIHAVSKALRLGLIA